MLSIMSVVSDLEAIIVFLIIFLLLLAILVNIIIFLAIGVIQNVLKSNKTNKQKAYHHFNNETKDIVFLGDSLTELFNTNEFFKGTVCNRGISAEKSSETLTRLDDIIALNPKKIFLQIGTNDLGDCVKPNIIISNIEKIITVLKQSLPKATIYLISLYPVNSKKIFGSRYIVGKRKNKTILEINQELVKIATSLEANYIDIYSSLVNKEGNLDPNYTIEGLHISHDGYCVIEKILRPFIEESN